MLFIKKNIKYIFRTIKSNCLYYYCMQNFKLTLNNIAYLI